MSRKSHALFVWSAFTIATIQPDVAFASSATQTPNVFEIGSVRAEVHGNGEATISWTTDARTEGWITYGPGNTLVSTATDPGTSERHAVELTGLSAQAPYSYRVWSRDSSGNVIRTPRRTFQSGGSVTGSGFEIAGRMEAWFPLTLDFPGPFATERDTSPNPFLDYRLEVEFSTPDGRMVTVPGFFDGDGEGGGSGNVWRLRFAPHIEGTWSFVAHFRSGTDVAIETSPTAGSPASFNGTTGTFEIQPIDPNAEGFYKWGKLVYVNDHYLQFYDGPYFIKGGSNSPENLLGYAGFDNTSDHGGLNVYGLIAGLHRFEPHIPDWGPASSGGLGGYEDPLFKSADSGVDSKGLVGALNYLSDVNVNSLFFLPMNLGGDGWEVCPYVGYDDTSFDKTHYDVSKLRQWNEVLEHTARKGLYIQFVLGETEIANEKWLDNGKLGRERKLFYREMIARFGHLPAIKWNISEECEFTTAEVEAFAGYIRDVDPFDHPVGFHVNLLPLNGDSQQYDDVLGDPRFNTNSLQAIPYTASVVVEKWREDSAAAGRPWVVEFDEQLQGLTDQNATELRKLQLYDTLFSGGHIEWYAGYHTLPLGGDLRKEDFRTREEMWNYTWYARKFLEENVPFWVMNPNDDLIEGESNAYGGAEVFARRAYYYVAYYPNASNTGTLDLRHTRKRFTAQWYNPRTGQFEGPAGTVIGGKKITVPPPPSDPGEDWVFLVKP